MQYCGAEREATLREAYLNASHQVQNLRQFVCELEQHSQVGELNIVTHLRSESQLEHLQKLKADQQRIVIEYQFSASLHEKGSLAGQHARRGMRSRSGHVYCKAKRNAPNTTVQSSVL